MVRNVVALALVALVLTLAACGRQQQGPVQLAAFPLDDLEGLVDRDEELSIDSLIHVEGAGALLIRTAQRRVVKLFEIQDPDVEDALLTYSARLKCQSLGGRGYLEMWCRFPGEGEFFGRGLDSPVGRSMDWRPSQAVFRLEKGQNPDRIRLNLVLEGGGVVWVDDVKLTAGPLPR